MINLKYKAMPACHMQCTMGSLYDLCLSISDYATQILLFEPTVPASFCLPQHKIQTELQRPYQPISDDVKPFQKNVTWSSLQGARNLTSGKKRIS